MGQAPVAEIGIVEFAEFCSQLRLEDGTRMELEPFQRTMLGDYFAGAREEVILIPKKNGKTSLLAALGLYSLLTSEDANICIAASSRDQAMVLFEQMRGFVQRTPEIEDEVRVLRGYREIRRVDPDDPDNPKVFRGIIKVYAADADTADGVLPTLALVDELHRHKSSELYAVFRDGLGPRSGQMITISTAGDDENSPLGELRRDAYTRPGVVRDGPYRYIRDEDFALHEWALEPNDDPDDIELVKRANPASWQTVEELRRRRDSPSTKSWEWQRFACGLWVAGEEAAISAKEWNACAQLGLEIPGGADGVFVGIDLAFRHDCTAFVACANHGDIVAVHPPTIIEPPGDGTSTPYEAVWEAALEYADRWPRATFVLDPRANGEELAQQLERELPLVRVATHTQMAATMALAAQRLSLGISTRKIRHPDDRQLNAHVLAGAAQPVGEAWRFVKRKKKAQPIDGLIALAMAYSVLSAEAQTDRGGYFL